MSSRALFFCLALQALTAAASAAAGPIQATEFPQEASSKEALLEEIQSLRKNLERSMCLLAMLNQKGSGRKSTFMTPKKNPEPPSKEAEEDDEGYESSDQEEESSTVDWTRIQESSRDTNPLRIVSDPVQQSTPSTSSSSRKRKVPNASIEDSLKSPPSKIVKREPAQTKGKTTEQTGSTPARQAQTNNNPHVKRITSSPVTGMSPTLPYAFGLNFTSKSWPSPPGPSVLRPIPARVTQKSVETQTQNESLPASNAMNLSSLPTTVAQADSTPIKTPTSLLSSTGTGASAIPPPPTGAGSAPTAPAAGVISIVGAPGAPPPPPPPPPPPGQHSPDGQDAGISEHQKICRNLSAIINSVSFSPDDGDIVTFMLDLYEDGEKMGTQLSDILTFINGHNSGRIQLEKLAQKREALKKSIREADYEVVGFPFADIARETPDSVEKLMGRLYPHHEQALRAVIPFRQELEIPTGVEIDGDTQEKINLVIGLLNKIIRVPSKEAIEQKLDSLHKANKGTYEEDKYKRVSTIKGKYQKEEDSAQALRVQEKFEKSVVTRDEPQKIEPEVLKDGIKTIRQRWRNPENPVSDQEVSDKDSSTKASLASRIQCRKIREREEEARARQIEEKINRERTTRYRRDNPITQTAE